MAKTYSCVLVGVDVHTIEIETVIGNGFSGLNILGLPTDVTRDMRERIRSALECINIPIPARRVVVNIGNNDLLKLSRTPLSQLDFAVAASIIRALMEEENFATELKTYKMEYLAGELSLSGELKSIQNQLVYEAITPLLHEESTICLPKSFTNSEKPYLEYFENLKDWLENRKQNVKNSTKLIQYKSLKHPQTEEITITNHKIKNATEALSILSQNPKICVAMLVAALGKHNLIVAGEPGIGKSFSLKKFANFLPPLSEKEKIEVKLIHQTSLIEQRPFRFPHHSTTSAALIGGASLKPGEVTLAHQGVLFLDELAEFNRSSLEALREPLDSQCVTLSRSNGNILYPAKFQLCATTNPCPCGYYYSRKKACRCNPTQRSKYLQKISGPLLDRFCLQIWLEQNNSETEDIFSRYLKKLLKDNKVESFIENFFHELIKNKHDKNLTTTFEINQDVSLRGQTKIREITRSFEKIFPQLRDNKKFYEDILTYRSLEKIFNSKY
jgi:magnesium chelatase family protein